MVVYQVNACHELTQSSTTIIQNRTEIVNTLTLILSSGIHLSYHLIYQLESHFQQNFKVKSYLFPRVGADPEARGKLELELLVDVS